MRTHSINFKNDISKLGRQISSRITYIYNEEVIKLSNSELNSITFSCESKLLKSVMKCLEVDSNVNIPIGTIFKYELGLKEEHYEQTQDTNYLVNKDYYSRHYHVGRYYYDLLIPGVDYLIGDAIISGTVFEFLEYEYIDYGNYIVKEVENKEDTNSYIIKAYDKMLYAMKPYEDMGITYPITIRDYINTICTYLGLTFADASNTFPNYDKEIPNELYLNSQGGSLDYTFRDVLDQLAEVTASNIQIDSYDRIKLNHASYTNNSYRINGSTTQSGTPTPTRPKTLVSKTGTVTQTIAGKEYTFNLGNIKLNKVGSLEDYIYLDTNEGWNKRANGKWKTYKIIGELTLDGSENWEKDYSNGSYKIKVNNMYIPGANIYYNSFGISNRFRSDVSYNQFNGSGYDGYMCGTTDGYIAFKYSEKTSLTSWKNWLSTNNIVVLYVKKATGIAITDITDENLIAQLNDAGIDIIDETYLKNINVKFGEKYGPINSIVLSRSAGADNVYLQDTQSVEDNGLCEFKIVDNQIMNFNDRSDYLQAILDVLDGLEYYINDFDSTGICYYEIGDIYKVLIGEETYNCLLLNDTIEVTQGLQENIYTEKPEETNTDYTKADKTDRKLNQTTLIVDKQQGQIESLISATNTITDELGNVYTKQQIDEIVDNLEGWTRKQTIKGGTNIFRNTGLWFTNSDDENNPYEFWSGVVKRESEDRAVNHNALLLQNATLSQSAIVPNGTYTISFKYDILLSLADIKVDINGTEYVLDDEETEFEQTIEVNSQQIKVDFICDTDDACKVYDLMVNTGSEASVYDQNQNETTTDTVNISKGITITSTDIPTTFKANADGVRIYANSDLSNPKTKFTDKGTTTEEVVVNNKAEIVGLLFQKIGNQTWISKM